MNYDACCFSGSRISLVIKARQEKRLIVSRNSSFLRYSDLDFVVIKSEILNLQLKELQERLNIQLDQDNIFSRCLACNTELLLIEKSRVENRIPVYTYKTYSDFKTCPNCHRIFWPGSHWDSAKKEIRRIKNGNS